VINPRTADDTPGRAGWGNLGRNFPKNCFMNIFKNKDIQNISEIPLNIWPEAAPNVPGAGPVPQLGEICGF
jgi:hypothetical protein